MPLEAQPEPPLPVKFLARQLLPLCRLALLDQVSAVPMKLLPNPSHSRTPLNSTAPPLPSRNPQILNPINAILPPQLWLDHLDNRTLSPQNQRHLVPALMITGANSAGSGNRKDWPSRIQRRDCVLVTGETHLGVNGRNTLIKRRTRFVCVGVTESNCSLPRLDRQRCFGGDVRLENVGGFTGGGFSFGYLTK
jgi:hypothetical protein